MIDAVNAEEFERLKSWVGFTAGDVTQLHELGPALIPYTPRIAEQFCRRLTEDPQARKFVIGGSTQLEKLRQTMTVWLQELFTGQYGKTYFEKRCKIGRAHVKIELPQRFVFIAMNVIRTELINLIHSMDMPAPCEKQNALNKLLDLELAIVQETYHQDFVAKIRSSDKVSMQQRLEEVKHMAEIGQLAASLAHEIKNPLAGISGAIQIISKEMDSTNPHLNIMHEILLQIDRLDSAVKDLLVFARPKPPELACRDIGKTIRDCLKVLRDDPGIKFMSIKCQGLNRRIQAMIDITQFEQVISNLILNAAQACDRDGQVRIKLNRVDGQCQVQIQDNGTGMTQEVLERALEPFFTTKARGTGLGLPICKKIIEAHQGLIAIKTAPRKGTLVEILLPGIKSADNYTEDSLP